MIWVREQWRSLLPLYLLTVSIHPLFDMYTPEFKNILTTTLNGLREEGLYRKNVLSPPSSIPR